MDRAVLSRSVGQCLSGVMMVLAAAVAAADDGTTTTRNVDFQADVAPILKKQCIECHGSRMQLSGLRLDQRKFAIDEGRDRSIVVPGKSDESLLIQRLVDKKLGLLMPPTFPFYPEDTLGLSKAEIDILKQWVDQGAAWPDGVSLDDSAATTETAAARSLFAAIRAGDRTALERLRTDRTLATQSDRHGATPLMYAALYGDLDLLKLLVELGADVNSADHTGATALMWGAGHLPTVQWLVEHGAKVDVHSTLGRSPLLIAATYTGNAPVVKFLLKSGAKINDRDLVGETALICASKRGDVELVAALLEAGADVKGGGGFQGRSPLVWAADEGSVEVIKLLLDKGAGDDPKSLNGALFNATVRGPLAAVRLLLDKGASAKDPSGFAGYTPLMGAAYSENSDVETVKLLLERGADVHSKSALGETALQLAARRGRSEIVALLTRAGAKDPEAEKKRAEIAASKEPLTVRAAAEKSLALLQKCGPEFFRKSGCVACHQQSVTSVALAEARLRGFPVDEDVAKEQVQVTAFTIKILRDRYLQRIEHPANSAPATGYVLMGLAAEKYAPDEFTDANVIEMANRQYADGSWTAFSHRPPLEYSRIAATALAVRALRDYAPPALKTALEARITKAREWLVAAMPASNTDHAFRLLGLAWSGAPAAAVRSQVETLLSQQRDDGGWSQLTTLESDAYATGLTLFALHHGGGLATSEKAYGRGVQYLLKTQLPDGSWHVRTRSFPFQPYFESGFPHGPDQWISASATGWATAALIDAEPIVVGKSR